LDYLSRAVADRRARYLEERRHDVAHQWDLMQDEREQRSLNDELSKPESDRHCY